MSGGGETAKELRGAGSLAALDQATAWVEKPVRRVARSGRLNPLPHAGTISVFLLGVTVVSGLYITLFFEYGHAASYDSVAAMEGHAIQRVVRALHRYSSAALVLTSLIHGWRILTAARFVGRQRRLRWATGISAVALVWLTGVTGYWLVWDTRAQALNEMTVGLIGRTGTGAELSIDHLGVLAGRSGSGFMLAMWSVHLFLTAVIGWFMYRHLRRSNLPWLPPHHMTALMGGALLLTSIVLPLGMLPPAQPERLIGEIPLDPFILFLLPPLLSEQRWLVLVGAILLLGLALLLPRLLRRRDPEVIVIDEQACTGCELCVIDCPYQALTMESRGPSSDRLLAVLDEQRCVSCGICLGSCAFGAIELPGYAPEPPADISGRALVIACDRHPQDLTIGDDLTTGEHVVIHRVGCAGMVAPDTIRQFAAAGAESIQVIGCAPHDCRYGLGNKLAAERLSGKRSPHPAARYAKIVTQDWVPGDRVQQALRSPGQHPAADGRSAPRREMLLGVGLLTVLTVTGVAFATSAPFQPGFDQAELRLVVDHEAGQALRATPESGAVGSLAGVDVSIDNESIGRIAAPGGSDRWTTIVDLALPDRLTERSGTLRVTGLDSETDAPLFEAPLVLGEGNRLVVDLTDVPAPPTVADGRRIFTSRAGGCSVCHSVDRGDDGVGPSLAGIASVAGTRVEGLSPEQYLRQSILLPDQYIVDGWPAGQMLPIYRDRLSAEELDAVISYLLTLEEGSP